MHQITKLRYQLRKHKMAFPNVGFTRPELTALLPQYNLIRDCLSGEPRIKAARKLYLPMPNETDQSPENLARYDAYVARAVFYNVTRRTLAGLLGQVFMVEPVIELPATMEVIKNNATGSGVSLVQDAKKALAMALAYSRCGIFVDYPEAPEGGTSLKALAEGSIRPTINTFAPQTIVNWRVIEQGAEEILSLVVIYEPYCVEDDGFEMKNSYQYRVLRLNESGIYEHEIWRENIPTEIDAKMTAPRKGDYRPYEKIIPRGADGNPLTRIPFMFIGSENNDSNVDSPNMYDLASINIAHYRNSADYEESCYVVGQPTPVVIGVDEEWVKNVLKGVIAFGSRGGIPLPSGADAKLLQAEPNTMMKEAMEAKERQMTALGAKLVEQKDVQRTATETRVEATSEGSILSSTTKNVSAAYLWALKECAKTMGLPETGINFELNTDFDLTKMTPEELRQVIDTWMKGSITFEEMRAPLRKAGLATEDDEIAKGKIEADTVKAMAMEAVLNEPGDGSAKGGADA